MSSRNIDSEIIKVGKNVVIENNAVIRGINGKAKRIEIGDNSYIGSNVQIICDDFKIGDFCKIQHHTNIHGYNKCEIGHNAWIGQYTIIDSIGGTNIGDNCGIGAHSQLWSHIKFGDTTEGCRFNSAKPLIIGNDVWFVGHCIVSPIKAEDKSMALVGSVITSDMKANHVYGGSPSKDLTEKIGPQFQELSIDERYKILQNHLKDFKIGQKKLIDIKIIKHKNEIINQNYTYFVISDRKYTKRLAKSEIDFMNFLLPEKAKFTPYL